MYIVVSETQSNPFICARLPDAIDEVARQQNDGGMGNIWLVACAEEVVYFYLDTTGEGDYDEVQTEKLTDTDMLRGFYSPG